MLMLFSDVDHNAHSWFRTHAMALDSLTGQDIGFSIFSARIPILPESVTSQRIKLPRRPRSYRDGIQSWEISELITSGHLQLADFEPGQEIFAVKKLSLASPATWV